VKCFTPHKVKVRFQNPEIAGKYSSTFHAITTIIKEERFIGLFKGINSPLVLALCKMAIQAPLIRYFTQGFSCTHEWACVCIVSILYEIATRESRISANSHPNYTSGNRKWYCVFVCFRNNPDSRRSSYRSRLALSLRP
jgi:hypothetical protein